MLAVAAGAERMTQAMRSLEAAFLIGVEGVTEIWLVRHADCYEGMAEGPDPPLSPAGRMQAERLAERVRRIGPVAIYSSPYRRAVETARIIGDEVHEDPRLWRSSSRWTKMARSTSKNPQAASSKECVQPSTT